ncbi:esterase family protein [Enterovibrio sp. ZSDZ35]|uniref:Esterase family protein n=1 Tax=Enterovibrio qingdaonensis TaxID=2899818 RepID=A0ABT5QH79_9GAMM|nr:alpha/beta hydrolase-fold protein [Enterovibrio sp. ZSDZ35]MDD1780340.1 esterase family protein [Enterovibrio sp. ZSDZ35]
MVRNAECEVTLYQGVIERISFEAPSLKDNLAKEEVARHLVIYLPQSYSEENDRRYPIIYVMHGMEGTPQGWFSENPAEPGLNHIMDSLVASTGLEEMILVSVDGTSSLKGCWFLNSPVSGNFFDYLTKDVIDVVEKKYRVASGKRAIFGHSMGGFSALYAAMHRPDLYQACAALSPAGMMMRKHDYRQHGDFFKQQIGLLTTGRECEWFMYAYVAILRAISPDVNNPPSYISNDMDTVMATLEDFHLTSIAQERVSSFLPYLQGGKTIEEESDIASTLALYAEIGTEEGDAVGDPILDSFNSMIKHFEALEIPIVHHVFEGGHVDKIEEQVARGLRFISDEFRILPNPM